MARARRQPVALESISWIGSRGLSVGSSLVGQRAKRSRARQLGKEKQVASAAQALSHFQTRAAAIFKGKSRRDPVAVVLLSLGPFSAEPALAYTCREASSTQVGGQQVGTLTILSLRTLGNLCSPGPPQPFVSFHSLPTLVNKAHRQGPKTQATHWQFCSKSKNRTEITLVLFLQPQIQPRRSLARKQNPIK